MMGQTHTDADADASMEHANELGISGTQCGSIDGIRLSIDKISLTVDLPEEHRKNIKKFVNGIKDGTSPHKLPFHPVRDRFYRYGFRIFMNDLLAHESSKSTAVTVQTESTRPNTRNTLLMFNPSKIAPASVAIELLDHCLNIPPHSLMGAFVSTIHIACDIPNISLDDLVVSYPKVRRIRNSYSSGRTLYLGGESGNTKLAIYDKRAEIKAQNAKFGKFLELLKTPVPKHDLLRIECRMTPPTLPGKKVGHFPFSQLLELPNLLKKTRIHELPESLNRMEYVVLSLARHESLVTAKVRSKMSQAEWKAMIRKLYKTGSPDWWQPKYIWDEQFPGLAFELMEPFISEADFPLSLEHAAE